MMDIAIKVEHLSKVYRLYDNPLERLKESLHPFRKKYHRDFYALNDVSFEVKKGETVGIIGKNGSGKSTLLKILTGVLTPSEGDIITNGKISALLELGTGFNPEFTGIENIYFSGTIMGYSREEMHLKLDDIVSFADIGEFVYQPVKLYSSGMYVRLAFSCAVNVDPDILIVDEALAVGDVRFQKKCFDKMNIFKDRGKTILVVSHDINIMKTFPSRGILIDKGQIIHNGDPGETVLKYIQMIFPEAVESQRDNKVSVPAADAPTETTSDGLAAHVRDGYCLEIVLQETDTEKSFGAGGAWINWIKIYGLQEPNIFHGGEEIEMQISFGWDQKIVKKIRQKEGLPDNLIIGCGFENLKGITLFGFNMFDSNCMLEPGSGTKGIVTFIVKLPLLQSGDYFLSPAFALGTQEHHIQLRWYNNLIQLHCISNEKYVYGVIKVNYIVKELQINSPEV